MSIGCQIASRSRIPQKQPKHFPMSLFFSYHPNVGLGQPDIHFSDNGIGVQWTGKDTRV